MTRSIPPPACHFSLTLAAEHLPNTCPGWGWANCRVGCDLDLPRLPLRQLSLVPGGHAAPWRGRPRESAGWVGNDWARFYLQMGPFRISNFPFAEGPRSENSANSAVAFAAARSIRRAKPGGKRPLPRYGVASEEVEAQETWGVPQSHPGRRKRAPWSEA
jgi:hypothetical protein